MFGFLYVGLVGICRTLGFIQDEQDKALSKSKGYKDYVDYHGNRRDIVTGHKTMVAHDFDNHVYIRKDLKTGKALDILGKDIYAIEEERKENDRIRHNNERIKSKQEAKEKGEKYYRYTDIDKDGAIQFKMAKVSDDREVFKQITKKYIYYVDKETGLCIELDPGYDTPYNKKLLILWNKKRIELYPEVADIADKITIYL